MKRGGAVSGEDSGEVEDEVKEGNDQTENEYIRIMMMAVGGL